MRKTITLTIIAIFLFSLVPFAFAQDTVTGTNTGTNAAAPTTSSDVNPDTTPTSAKPTPKPLARAIDKREDIRDKREDVRDVKEDIRDATNIDRQRCIEKCKNDGSTNLANCEAKCKAADVRENIRDRLEDVREKNRERLAKIQGLDQRQIEKLSALDVKNVDKIAELKKERIERLSKLNEEKLNRISELEKDKLEKISDLNGTELDKFSALNRARLKEFAKLDEKRLKAEIKALKVVKIKNSDDLDRRNIPAIRLAQVKEKFEKAREEFKEAKDGLEDARKKLKEARDKKDENATLEHAKNYLLRTADALINHLEKIKAKVQESKNIPDDREAKIVAEIDAQIAEINQIKADMQAATTKEQIKESAKKLNDKWRMLKHLIRLHAERVVLARVEGLVNRGLVLEKRLDNVLAKAKEKGIEVDVSAEMNSFSEKIAASREKYKQAQAKLEEALDLRAKGEPADSEKIKSLVEEANKLLKEAREAIKEAHDILKTIVKKIKEAVPDADISAEVEVEVAQEPIATGETTSTSLTADTGAIASAETASTTAGSAETNVGANAST